MMKPIEMVIAWPWINVDMNNPIDKAWIVFEVFAVHFRIGKRILVILLALSQ